MTSKIVVNNIESDTGIATITISSPVSLSGGTTGSGFAVGTGASVYSPATNVLSLGTNNTEKLRITSGGNVQIANGNLVFSTSGTGIDFSATSNGSGLLSSELLDDYEEGTWTPTGPTGLTYGETAKGVYTKIGNVVHVAFVLENVSTGTASGALTVSLPFVADGFASGIRCAGSLGHWYQITSPGTVANALITLTLDNGSGIKFRQFDLNSGGDNELQVSSLSNDYIGGSLTYFTNS